MPKGADSMLFKIHFQSKVIKFLSLILTVTGIIFILASKHMGSVSVRLAMIILLILCLLNFKMTYPYLSMKEKTTHLLAALAALAGLLKPESTILLLGIILLYISLPVYLKAIKNQDFTDVINIVISGGAILFALFCIFNSKAALQTIIIIIGIFLTVSGCLGLYQALTLTKDNKTEGEPFKFEDNTQS
jgi:uncharacterized membrane protein